jgi:hypothetical protein
MEYFAGLDVSMAETHVCVMTRNGAVIHNAKVPCAAPAQGARGGAPGSPRQPCEAAVKGNWGELGTWTLAQSQLEIAIRRVYDELDGKLSS